MSAAGRSHWAFQIRQRMKEQSAVAGHISTAEFDVTRTHAIRGDSDTQTFGRCTFRTGDNRQGCLANE